MPKTKKIFKCSECGKQADIEKDPHAVDGWTISPVEICWECNQKKAAEDDGAEDASLLYMNRVLNLMEGTHV